MNTNLWDDLRQSLYNVFDHHLLENGTYVNITSGQKDVHGNDLSRFHLVDDPTFEFPDSGHIWQSAFHNFVYEEGVLTQSPPTVISGVYVNGTFVPKGPLVHIDHLNGRVIFNVAIPTDSIVQADYSYKEYTFCSPDMTNPYKSKDLFTKNSKTDNTLTPAKPDTIYLPAIILELQEASEKGFEFGGVHQSSPVFKMTVVSTSQAQVESISSVLTSFSTKCLPIVSATGGPVFDFYKDLTENYSFGAWVAKARDFGYIKSVNYNRFYDLRSENQEPSLFGGILTVNILAIR